jgi:hypothetical protein
VTYYFSGKTYGPQTYFSLLPIIGGIFLIYYGSLDSDGSSLCFTLLGALLASNKTIYTNWLQTRQQLPFTAIELLHTIIPVAATQSAIWAYMNGEVDEFLVKEIYGRNLSWALIWCLPFSGLLAFLLNWSSFTANKATGALSMTVAGNVKQILTLMLAMILFESPTNPVHVWGTLEVPLAEIHL